MSCFEAPHTQTPPPKLFSPWILQDAYSEIAYLFAEFFRDLDIVPSDIIAGLVLLRQRQRAKRNAVLDEVGGGGHVAVHGGQWASHLASDLPAALVTHRVSTA